MKIKNIFTCTILALVVMHRAAWGGPIESQKRSASMLNLRALYVFMRDDNTGTLLQKLDLEAISKSPRNKGMKGSIPMLFICPMSGKPYIYRPFAGKIDGFRNPGEGLRIIAFSPEPDSMGKRCILDGDFGAVFEVTEVEFQEICANNFEYKPKKAR